MTYKGSTAVITGGGSGLGAAMADLFAGAGANVVLLDIDGARAEAKAAELRHRGVDALAVAVDVASADSVCAAAATVTQQYGRCDVLCANVGVQQFGAVDRLTAQDWSWVLSVNVMGVIHTVDAFLPLLRRADGDRHIVVTSSASYFTPGVRMAAYVTTKYAVTGYAEVLRRELAAEGINVALLFPGGMVTRHLESSVAARPAALGASRLAREDIDAMMASVDMTVDNHVATADHAVRNLLAELREHRPYIITHGSYQPQVEAQQREVLAAFERMLANP